MINNRRPLRSTYRNIISLMCMMIVSCILLSSASFADTAESKEKLVRIGYVNVKGYEEGGDGEYKYGFGYEYFQKISYHTGWTYEYVYGSFSELIEMLSNGEIDVLGNVTPTQERQAHMNFSLYPQGSETFYVFTDRNRKDLLGQLPDALNSQKIAVGKGTYQAGLLKEFIEKNDLDVTVVECNGTQGLVEEFSKGTVDALVMTDAVDLGYAPIHLLGVQDYYFAVSKERTDLLDELNDALYLIKTADPGYNITVSKRYSFGTVMINYLTPEEEEWVKDHDNTVNIGYLDDNMPYSDTADNGSVSGVLQVIITYLTDHFGIRVNTKAYAKMEDLKKALYANEIDCYGPAYGDFYLSEVNRVIQSESIMTTTPVLLYKTEPDTSMMAVSEKSIFCEHVIKTLYPEAEIVVYETIADCMEAVDHGEVGSTLITSGKLNVLHKYKTMDNLDYTEIMKNAELCLFVNAGQGHLATIIDKAIALSGPKIMGAAFVTGSDGKEKQSLEDVIHDHLGEFFAVITLILVLLSGMLISLLLTKKKMRLAKEEAEKANRSKSEFLFNMSHDIRTPMNAIIGFTRLAKDHLDDQKQAEMYLDKIDSSNEFLLSIINNVLDMARIESGKEALDEEPCNMMELGKEIVTMFSADMEAKGVQFTPIVHVKHPNIYADEAKIRKIMLNLLSNAGKYTPSGGKVTMTITEKPSDKEGYVIYENVIEDTGIGMSEGFMEHLFDPFVREHNTTESKIIGTGLGMPIVKKLVDLMHGTIQVESVVGKGTRFTVTNTHRIVEDEALIIKNDPLSVNDQTLFKGKRILLAEDNELNAEIAVAILEEVGFMVDRAEDGVVCVKMLGDASADRYDVILMDVQMPNMDGYQATLKIRRMEDLKKASIPIIAMTANAFEEDRQNAFAAGMNGFIPKPIKVEEVYRQLGSVLGK